MLIRAKCPGVLGNPPSGSIAHLARAAAFEAGTPSSKSRLPSRSLYRRGLLSRVRTILLLIAAVRQLEPTMSSAAPTLEATVSERIHRIWQAYGKGDIDAHNALLADDYTAVFPDGTLHLRRPTLEEIRSSPMSSFALSDLRVAQVTPDTALASYVADVEGPLHGKTIHIRWRVGELWVRRRGEWKCRSYQPTPVAPFP